MARPIVTNFGVCLETKQRSYYRRHGCGTSAHAHVPIFPLFHISETVRRIALKFGMWLESRDPLVWVFTKVNRRPAGRGRIPTPCRIFSIAQKLSRKSGRGSEFKNGGRYRRETFSPFLSINLTSATKILETFVQKFLRKLCFSDVMYRHYGPKKQQMFEGC